MCCGEGSAYKPEGLEIVYRIAKTRRPKVYAYIQVCLVLVGLIVSVAGIAGYLGVNGVFIGVVIMVLGGLVPRPFFANWGRVGDTYLVFDEERRAVVLVRGRSNNSQFKKKDLCAYPHFRGIAYYEKTNELLVLIKGHDSYATTAGDQFDTEAVTDISLWWYSNYANDRKVMHFGPTLIPLDEGIQDATGDIAVDYSYWKKTKKERGDEDMDKRVRVRQKSALWDFGGRSLDVGPSPPVDEDVVQPVGHSAHEFSDDNPWNVRDNV